VMAKIYLGLPGFSAETLRDLEWPMANATVRADFERLGTKGGSLVGILTSAYYAKPKGDKPARVLAVFFQNVPVPVWPAMETTVVHQEFERRLLLDDTFVAKVRAALAAP